MLLFLGLDLSLDPFGEPLSLLAPVPSATLDVLLVVVPRLFFGLSVGWVAAIATIATTHHQ